MGLTIAIFNILYDVAKWATIATAVIGTCMSLHLLYNIYFHPLRAFPGPLANRATIFPKYYHLLSGDLPYYIANLHDKHGSVVRIAPNELAFRDPQAWKDIYTRKSKAYELPHDMAFYNAPDSHPTSVLDSTREVHDPVRKLLLPGFSERALRAQEPVIRSCVDLLMQRLKENCTDQCGLAQALNIRDWVTYTTFDIIGTLAFGSDFGCLSNSAYHPWITLVIGSLKESSMMQLLKAMGVLHMTLWLMKILRVGVKARQMHIELTGMKTRQRLEMGTGRNDFIDGLIKSGMPFEQLKMNGSLLILAGSETTATLLTGAIFLLGTHQDVLDKLAAEVRGQFKSKDDINFTNIKSLSYMLAVLNESLRFYPPFAIAAPRVVPEEGAEIAGHPVPPNTTVGVWHWAMYHDPALFANPYHFDPKRWSDNYEKSEYADDRLDCVNPFLVGPRNCIGQTLAYAEMRLILTRLIWEFNIAICEDSMEWMKDQPNYLLWDKPALNVRLQPVRG